MEIVPQPQTLTNNLRFHKSYVPYTNAPQKQMRFHPSPFITDRTPTPLTDERDPNKHREGSFKLEHLQFEWSKEMVIKTCLNKMRV